MIQNIFAESMDKFQVPEVLLDKMHFINNTKSLMLPSVFHIWIRSPRINVNGEYEKSTYSWLFIKISKINAIVF